MAIYEGKGKVELYGSFLPVGVFAELLLASCHLFVDLLQLPSKHVQLAVVGRSAVTPENQQCPLINPQ